MPVDVSAGKLDENNGIKTVSCRNCLTQNVHTSKECPYGKLLPTYEKTKMANVIWNVAEKVFGKVNHATGIKR